MRMAKMTNKNNELAPVIELRKERQRIVKAWPSRPPDQHLSSIARSLNAINDLLEELKKLDTDTNK